MAAGETTLSRLILNSTLDAVIIIDASGMVHDWNERAESLFGWTAAETAGRRMADLIIPPRYREAHERGMSRFLATGHGPILGRRMELSAVRRDGDEFPVELTVSAARDGENWKFIGILRDQSLEKQAQGRLQVQNALFRMLSESPGLDSVEQTLLDAVCNLDPWQFGACWRPEGELLRCSALRERTGKAFPQFRARTLDTTLRKGEGLPGRVWETGRPMWIKDVQGMGLHRLDAAAEEGLHAAFALPVLVRQEVAIIFEFFSPAPRGEPKDDLIAFADSLAGQLGLYLERKAAEEEVRSKERRFRALMEASTDAIAVLLPDGKVTFASDSTLNILGFTAGEYMTMNGFERIHPDDLEPARLTVAGILGTPGASAATEIRVQHKDGSWRWIEGLATNLLDDPAIGGILVNYRDITEKRRGREERERLMEQLRDEQERLSAVLDFTPTPMVLVEPSTGRLVFANKAAHATSGGNMPLGLTAAEFPEDNYLTDGAGNRVPREQDPSLRAARGETLSDLELTWHVAGAKRALLINSATLRGKEGKPESIVIAFQDLTHVKQVEEQLRQSQKMEAIGQLAGGIAHDFNNLLTAINGYSSMALEQLPPADPLHGFMSEVLRSGERAAGLTRQLLAYSRKQVLEAKLWDLNTIVSEMQAMLRRIIGEDIILSTELAPVPVHAKVDRGQVEQILLNLSLNSRDAMPGGGRLILETRRVELDGEIAALHPESGQGPHVVLAVTDTGTGMAPDVKARIFEPFYTTKEVGKGTGLGLSSVYGIIKQSGGSISVYSEPGQGTTFHIYFPEAAAEGGRREEVLQVPPSYRGNETILLVEDEETVRRFASQALEVQGYTVLKAANGREALGILSRQAAQVSLVVTDVVMPDMGGQVLADQLRDLHPDLPILFISGYTESSVIHRGLMDRRGSFLQKPFGPSDLARSVRDSLDGKNLNQRAMEKNESE